MSLAYPPRFIKNLLTSKKERTAARSSAPARGEYGTFPAEIGLYYDQPGDEYLSQWFYLSENPASDDPDAKRKDLYAVTFHKGLSRSLTVYATTQHGSTPLALATSARPYVSSVSITTASEKADDMAVSTYHLRFDGFSKDSYSFEHDGERFVWQPVPKMGSRVRHLTRSATSRSVQSSPDDSVLAVWREGTVPNRNYRLATLRFVGTNTAQHFGNRWRIVVVCAALAICQQGVAVDGAWSWYEEKLLERPVTPKAEKHGTPMVVEA